METLKTFWDGLPRLLPPGEEGILWIFGVWAIVGLVLALAWVILSRDPGAARDASERRRRP